MKISTTLFLLPLSFLISCGDSNVGKLGGGASPMTPSSDCPDGECSPSCTGEACDASADPETTPPSGVSSPNDDSNPGPVSSSTGGSASVVCSNDLPDAGEGWETCDDWAEWGHCSESWMTGKCNQSCQRCELDEPDDDDDFVPPEVVWGEPNPYPPLSGGEQTYSTRYWDCCKPSCGWSSQPNTVDSCNLNGDNIGVDDGVRSSCEGGQAQTCHGMAPFAVSNELSYGFVAANGRTCGSCYQLQFTGQGNSDPEEPGSQALAGKTMIVMVTNTGGELGDGHFDILIPGGGLGIFNGCTAATGIPANELGQQYGGFIADCSNGGSLESRKECVRNRCQAVFGSRGLTDLEEGCLWQADWFQTADNPRFIFEEVECPAHLSGYN